MYNLIDYDFDLPEELIAQHPVQPRDSCRLMVIDRQKGLIEHDQFRDLKEILQRDDLLVLNNTKVIPARLMGTKKTGGKVEILLTKPLGEGIWEVMMRGKPKAGDLITVGDERVEILAENRVRLLFPQEKIATLGAIPLPPYIRSGVAQESDRLDYQTVFAKEEGAIAAPTAGLHFTNELISELQEKGVHFAEVTLHVGQGTFLPVKVSDIRQHQMHSEEFFVPDLPPAKRRIAVGTTALRALESHAAGKKGSTDIFIYPGYEFRAVDALITNFHLPQSTLLMLVSAFAGIDLMREAYAKAIEARYRFFSYGDAMLLL